MIPFLPKALLNPGAADQVTSIKARTYLIVNLLVCPGIGTLLGGRRAGLMQAGAFVAGFCMLLGFVAIFFNAVTKTLLDPFADESALRVMTRPHLWLLIVGAGLSIVAWICGLLSGLSILRAAKAREAKPPAIPLHP